MSDSKFIQTVYIAQNRKKPEEFALVDVKDENGYSYLNFEMSFDHLAGYLESVWSDLRTKDEKQMANGMPDEVRGNPFPGKDIQRLDNATLEKLLEASAVKSKLVFAIRQY